MPPKIPPFATRHLPEEADVTAPDGSDVRILLALAGGSLAHFALAPGKSSLAVTHHTVEEIWYFLGGEGEMWRRRGDQESVVNVKSGVCLTIPLGTWFQFRSCGSEPLTAVAVTMPPWPGDHEAQQIEGPWEPSPQN